jgi:hypothetical protein
MQETELQSEFEQELHEQELHEQELHELEAEQEGLLGGIGNILGGLLGEGESTGEMEAELEGVHELELEGEFEGEGEGELELESGEQFFGGIGRFLKRAAPLLKQVARVAAPIVGTAIGGPAGTALGGLASKLLSETEMELEGEGELELEGELEGELEAETESLHEVAHEISSHETTMHEALAEMMAEAASHEMHEGQAEALVGAATVTVLSPRDRRALRRLLPHLVRGAAVLTRILRRRAATRPAVRAVPTIMRRTVSTLKKQAAAGRPITRRTAARAAARQVRRVLANPRAVGAAVACNMRAGRAMRRPQRRFAPVRG